MARKFRFVNFSLIILRSNVVSSGCVLTNFIFFIGEKAKKKPSLKFFVVFDSSQ